MCMETRLDIDETLLRKVAKLAGVSENTGPVRLGLEALVVEGSGRRCGDLGSRRRSLSSRQRRNATKAA